MILKIASEYYNKRKKSWDAVKAQDKMQVSNSDRTRAVGEDMFMEAINVEDWLNKIKKLAK